MLDMLRGEDERDAEIERLEAQVKALKEADARDFLADNSDQLAKIISTKNEVPQLKAASKWIEMAGDS